jgi:cysteine desulfurase
MKGYFDYNATTPLLPAAREAWLKASDAFWYNASGLYREGGAVHRHLDHARERLGDLLGADPERIVFTGGATESNNAVVRSIARRNGASSVVLSSPLEHPSLREPLRRELGARVVELTTTEAGVCDVGDLEKKIAAHHPALVTLMAANNECGTLQPWKEAARLCKDQGIPFHVDAAQWVGKLPSEGLGECDYVTGSGHKFGGPKGIGFLVLREESEPLDFLFGGPQENGRRAGTENYPAIEGMVTALETLAPRLEEVRSRQSVLRAKFIGQLRAALGSVRVIGEGADCLWNTVMFVAPQGDNRKWCARLSQAGFQVSTGSACSAIKDGSSVVLAALGASLEEMRRVIRISAGWDTTEEDWEGLAGALGNVKN